MNNWQARTNDSEDTRWFWHRLVSSRLVPKAGSLRSGSLLLAMTLIGSLALLTSCSDTGTQEVPGSTSTTSQTPTVVSTTSQSKSRVILDGEDTSDVDTTTVDKTGNTGAKGTFKITYPTTYINETAPLIQWTKPLGGTLYDLVIATDSGCKIAKNLEKELKEESFQADTLTQGTYYLCVYAPIPGDKVAEAVNSPLPFTIDTEPPTIPEVTTVAETYINTLSQLYSWVESVDDIGIYGYNLELGYKEGRNDALVVTIKDATSYEFTGVHGKTYHARVSSVDLAHNLSAFSKPFGVVHIDTKAPPKPKPPIGVISGSFGLLTYSWLDPIDDGFGVKSYRLQIGTTPGGKDILDQDLGKVLSYSFSGTDSVTYYARVQAIDYAANASAFSDISLGEIVIKPQPQVTSFLGANEASDSFINAAEINSVKDAVVLLAEHYVTATFTAILPGGTLLVCDGLQTYNLTTVPIISTIPAIDGDYAVCVKLVNGPHTTYGKSVVLFRDIIAPSFASVDLAGDVIDTFLNRPEAALTNPLLANVQAAGHDTVSYKIAAASSTCDGILTYSLTPPTNNSSDFSAQGAYKVCLAVEDNAANPVAYGQSATFTFDSIDPVFTSIDLAGPAVDSYININENAASQALVENLVATGYQTVKYKLTSQATSCDGSLTYSATIPPSDSADFAGDGAYKVCLELVDQALNPPVYAASDAFTLDSQAPVFTSIDLANEALDTYINLADHALNSSLLANLTGSGYDSVTYKIVSAATVCDEALTYQSAATNDDPDLAADGSYKVCVALLDAAGNATYGSSNPLTVDLTVPAFTSIDLANDGLDGYLNLAEHALATDLVANLVAAGHDTAAYKLVPTATSCDGALAYGALPQADTGDFGGDGDYKVCVKLSDDAGNPDTFGSSPALALDTTPPQFNAIDLAGDAIDSFITLAEHATAYDLVANLDALGYDTATYKLVTNATSCDGALVYGGLPQSDSADFGADGSYKVCIKLDDTAGNPADYGSSSAFVLDTVVPTFTSIALALDAVDGYINLAETAQNNVLADTLVASGYNTVTYKLSLSATACDGALVYGVMPQSDSGDFAADGTYKVCVKLDDDAGNPSAYGSSNDINLDTLVPSFTSIALANDVSDSYLNLAERALTNDLVANLVATGYDSANYKLVSSATACDGALVYGALPQSDSGDFAADGTYKVCTKVSDLAGNPVDYGSSNAFTLDSDVPVFTSIDLANDAIDTYVNLAETSLGNDLVTNLTASGQDSVGYKLVVTATACDGALVYGALPQSNSGDFGADGTYKVCVKLDDLAGNPSAYGQSNNITLDKTVPAFTSIDLANDAVGGYINLAEHAANNSLLSNLVATGYDTATYKLVSAATSCDGALVYGAMPSSDSGDFAGDASYKVCVKLADNANNPADYGNSGAIILDTNVPSFTSLDLANDATDSYINLEETSHATALVANITGANYDSVSYKLVSNATACDGALVYGALPGSNTADFAADGSYKVCVKLEDNAANPPDYGASSAFTLDKTVPTFTSIDLTLDASDGYINLAESAASNDMVNNLNSLGYDTVSYRLATSATACDGALVYGAIPQSDSADFAADGSYKVCVKLQDNAGNPDGFGASSAIILDKTVPSFTSVDLANDATDTYINLAETSGSNDLVTNLVANGYDSANYKLVSNATACDVALIYGALPGSDSADFGADGSYKVCVKITDNAGNPADYGGSSAMTLDKTVPTFTSIDLINDSSDGYINATEHAASNDLIGNLVATGYDSVSYKLVANATSCDGALVYGAIPASDSGDFAADGSYKVCIKLDDNAGNPIDYSSSAVIGLDTLAPSFTSIALANDASDSFVNLAESSANNDLVDTLVGTGYDTATYKLVSTATTCDGALVYGTLPTSDSADFGADGSYKVCVKLDDFAGNTSDYGNSNAFSLDKTVPTFTSIDLANDASDSYINLAETVLTNALATNLTATGYDSASYKLVATATTCDGALIYGALPQSDSADFGADGAYKVCIKLSDNAGNPDDFGSSADINLDTVVPSFTSIDLINDAANGYINFAESSVANDLVGNLVASGYDTATYKLVATAVSCDGALVYGALPGSNSADFGVDGSYKVCLKLADNAGNPPAYDGSNSFSLDKTIPDFTSIDLSGDATDGYINLAEHSASNDLLTNIGATGYDTVSYKLVASAVGCDGALVYGAMPQSDSSDFGADGSYKVCIKLEDNAGNPNDYGWSAAIILDTVVPQFTSIALANDATDAYINLAENAASNALVDTLVAVGNDSASYKLVTNATTCDVALVYGALPASDSSDFAADGSYKVCVKVADTAGNPSDYGSSAAITLDKTVPSFTSIDLANDAIGGYINSAEHGGSNDLATSLTATGYDSATYKLATNATACDGALVYGAMPASDAADFGADGSYKVCVKLQDNAGNPASYGGSSSFVLDTTPPSFTSIDLANDAVGGYINASENALANDLVQNLTATGYDTPTYKLVSAATNCDNALVYGALPPSNSADFGADGSYKVCVRLDDNAGNSAAYGSSSNFTLDTSPEGNIDSFSATTHSVATNGAIDISLDFPAVHNYSEVKIRRVAGGSAPADCSSGSLVTTISSFVVDPLSYTDTALTPDSAYSYLACIYDAAGNENSAANSSNIKASKVHRIFVTSSSYSGDLVTAGGSDGLCQTAGDTIDNSETWIAVIGDAIDMSGIAIVGRVYNNNSTPELVASNHSDFWDGTFTNAIAYDEAEVATGAVSVWTGSNVAGAASNDTSCSLFSSASPLISGNTGVANQTSSIAIYLSQSGCHNSARLYCINQIMPQLTAFSAATGAGVDGDIDITVDFPATPTLYNSVTVRRAAGTTAPSAACNAGTLVKTYAAFADDSFTDSIGVAAGVYSYRICLYDGDGLVGSHIQEAVVAKGATHKVFITSTTYTGNAIDLASADAACDAIGDANISAQTWIAVLSDSSTTFASRATITTTVVNTQAQPIAESEADWLDSSLLFAIAYDESGAAVLSTERIWTGTTTAGGSHASTCIDWSDGTAGQSGAFGTPTSTNSSWSTSATAGCDQSYHIYCVSSDAY